MTCLIGIWIALGVKMSEYCKGCYERQEKIEDLIDEIGYLKSVLGQIKDLAMCGADCEHDCDRCMQGQIHQLIDKCLAKEG